jgi:pyridoxal phosphate enzyme (YggS family)
MIDVRLPDLPDAALVAERLAAIRGRMVDAGGDPAAIEVVAVTKGFPAAVIAGAVGAGLTVLGENYAQELLEKVTWLAGRPGRPAPAVVRWQFIGALQRNKVRRLARHVDRWQSVDRPELVDELARRAPGARLLLQVNTTGEAQKSGCEPDAVGSLVERATTAGLVVEGLMTVGPTDGARSPGPAFATLRRLVDLHGLTWCSMGMTDDLEVAVREGTNMVRVGRALFGPRPHRGDVGN